MIRPTTKDRLTNANCVNWEQITGFSYLLRKITQSKEKKGERRPNGRQKKVLRNNVIKLINKSVSPFFQLKKESFFKSFYKMRKKEPLFTKEVC